MAATSIRRNTFVIQDPSFPMPPPGPSSGMDRQNVMRLKVNRIALVQELKVEHILRSLIDVGVISSEDLGTIENGRTSQDKARLLVDLLPTKRKHTEWYKNFREALMNPDASGDTKKRYKLLVEFLDNTVIHRPTSQAGRFCEANVRKKSRTLPPLAGGGERNSLKIHHYQALPEISYNSKNGRDEYASKGYVMRPSDTELTTDIEDGMSFLSIDSHQAMTLVKGFFHQWLPTPDNFRSLLEIDKSHWDKLVQSGNPEDQLLMAREEIVLRNLRRLEVISALAHRKQLPSGFELCMCDAVQDILAQSELNHLYMKHIITLEMADIKLVHDICASYDTVILMLDSSSMTEIVNQVIQTGLRFSNFLIAINKLSDADHILSSMIQFLKKNPELNSWIPLYQAYVKQMQARNLACEPDKAQNAYFDAVQMQFQINMMSFGKDIIHEGSLHAETSTMLLEYGSLVSAFGWAKRALQEVDPNDNEAIMRSLFVAINAHCAQWKVTKAEELAVYAVQFARDKFGERHPMYIEALIHFCRFNNEFKKDAFGLKIAKELLDAVDKTYGCECIQMALAHRAVSRALMCAHIFETEEYYMHAMEAMRISRLLLGSQAPYLHIFLHTFASALQWKALHCPKEVHDSTLRWAEAEAKQALALVSSTFGEISLKSSQMLLLLGQIYSKMNVHPELEGDELLNAAERHLLQAVEYLKLCQPPSSNHLLLAEATLGTFYKIILKPEQAITHLRYLIDHEENSGWYLKWMHDCYENIASLYASLGQDKEVEIIQVKLSHWLKANPRNKETLDYSVLEQTPINFEAFVKKINVWTSTFHKILACTDIQGETAAETGEKE